MPEYTARYWFDDDASGDRPAYVSAGLTADSLDHATLIVQEQMSQPHFALDSDGYGRVVINSARVRFCSLLPAQASDESAAQTDIAAAAQAADFAARVQASGAVDSDLRRF
jgi:hypothetical protein